MQHFYQNIHGWFAFKHLYEKVAEQIPDGSTLVEIGSWQGRSLAYLAVELVNRGKLACKLVAIDKWMGSPGDGLHLKESMRPSFEKNLRSGGFFLHDIGHPTPLYTTGGLRRPELRPLSAHRADAAEYQPVINILERDSAEAATAFDDGSVDFLMVDGAHDYESCRRDVVAWLPKMAEGGLISGDDYNSAWPGVILGVRDIIPLCRLRVPPGAEARADAKQTWQHDATDWLPGVWDRSRHQSEPPNVLVFLPYVSSLPLLRRAVESLGPLAKNAIVIDQSPRPGLVSLVDAELPSWLTTDVLRVPYRSLTFSQLQNWMQWYARKLKTHAFFFMHSDAEVLDPSVFADALAKLEHPQVAACFTNYDALVAFDTEKMRQVGCWDESFEWYHADVDFYRRIRLRGFQIAEAGGSRVAHTPSQTIASDPKMKERVDRISKHMEAHYIHKWGGLNKAEKYSVPYNGKP